jgi:hypothetical protein
MRYNYAHAIHGINTSKPPTDVPNNLTNNSSDNATKINPSSSPAAAVDRSKNIMERRLSVMFRNVKEEEEKEGEK